MSTADNILDTIIREQPPASRSGNRGSERYRETADLLKGDPGEWYRISSGQRFPELAARIKRGTTVAFKPAGSFEAVARKQDGLWSVWARYVGTGSNV